MPTIDLLFANLTAASPIEQLCDAARTAGARAAASDLDQPSVRARTETRAAARVYLADPETRTMLETWVGAYRADEALLAALNEDDRADVLETAWQQYSIVVRGAPAS